MAQTIASVKNKKVLINTGGESWSTGDKVFAIDAQGKKRGLMQIRQVKGEKAVAQIIKGSASPGMAVILGASAHSGSGSANKGLRTGSAYGFTGALLMNTMKIQSYQGQSVEMIGTNFGGGMFYDYPLTSSWFVRGNGVIEMFDVKKTLGVSICNSGQSKTCSTTFTQAGFYGTFNFVMNPSPFRVWAGAGGGAIVYLAKKSTIIKTDDIFFNTVLMAAFGLDYFTSKNTFIPISLEYQTVPDKEAPITTIAIRAGWGTTF